MPILRIPIASHPYRWESEPKAKPTSYLLTLELMPRRAKLPAPMKVIEAIIPEPPTHQMEREILEQAGLDYWKWSILSRRLEASAESLKLQGKTYLITEIEP